MASTLGQSANKAGTSQDKIRNEHWIPLECTPELFNSWAQQAGLVISRDQFVDIYGLDGDLLSIVPEPAKAVVLLFPQHTGIKAKRAEHEEKINREGQHPIDQTVFFIKQTDENTCGTIALIHAIANSDVTYIPDSPLQKFISMCKDKTPEERGKLLASTDLFTKIHLDSSALEQTPQPMDEEDEMTTDLHFTCFVTAPDGLVRKAAAERQHTLAIGGESSRALDSTSRFLPPPPGCIVKATPFGRQLVASGTTPEEDQLVGMRLLELDGRRPYPVDHGPCVDVLDDVLNVVRKQYLSQVESPYFSLMAFGPTPPINSPFH